MSDTMVPTSTKLDNAIEQFRDFIEDNGLNPPFSIIPDGKRHRFSTNGKPDDDAGWYIFHDGPIPEGTFGDFRSGHKFPVWKAQVAHNLSAIERVALKAEQEELHRIRWAEALEKRELAKKKADYIVKQSIKASPSHPYLLKKNVKPFGLRTWKDMLVVPMIDETGELQSVQLISANGDKKFLSNGKMQGCYALIGDLKGAEMVMIAEGYATAATIHEITGHPVVVAFNAGNLSAVAKVIREKQTDLPIYICADDDHKTKGNPGISKATEAALAVGGSVIVPRFGENRPEGATDFNDMAAHLGKDAVTRFFIRHFLDRAEQPKVSPEIDDEPEVVTEKAILANPAPEPLPPRNPKIEPKTHFSGTEFEQIQKIWWDVTREASHHSEDSYQLLLDKKRKVTVTRDRIEMPDRPRHRPDAAYRAACDHARTFWNGELEVHGESQHRLKTWAYAAVYGVKVTNYTPNDSERIEAEKIIQELRRDLQPSFSAPGAGPGRPQTGKRSLFSFTV